MTIEMLGPDKLRVVLTVSDLSRYELDYASISSDNLATKRMVSDILTQAKTKTGFRYKNSKLLVEVVPGKNSGCVLYLTKTPSSSADKPGEENLSRTPKTGAAQSAYILSCACLDDTIDAIERFVGFPDIPLKQSSLYSLGGRYHLLFSPVMPGLDRHRLLSLLSELSEYGKADTADPVSEAFVREHGSAISSGRAVESFIRYFS